MRLKYSGCIQEKKWFCHTYPKTKMNNVGRPNVHQVRKLNKYKIPILGKALYIAEIQFESAHQSLKVSFSKNTTPNAHLTSIYHVLVKDLFTRFSELWKLTSCASEDLLIAAKSYFRSFVFWKNR